MKLSWLLLIGCLAACAQTEPEGLTRADLAKKTDMKARIDRDGLSLPPSMFCTARNVSPTTVETMYRLYVYDRGDLVSHEDNVAAARDVLNTFEHQCDGDIVKMSHELKADDEATVIKGFAFAMVKAGR